VAIIHTIGHSTRELSDLICALQAHGIRTLVDIRSIPMSRWLRELGGRRKRQRPDSPNVALRNDSFRNYADYMLTPEFKRGVESLLQISENGPTAIMCAERVYFRCHRMLVSDYLTAHGHDVLHIDNENAARLHQLMPEARISEGRLLYRGDRLL